MEWVTKNHRIPIKSWCKEVEKSAMEQAENLSKLPFAFHHIALMPDCHMGYGMPIGTVFAAEGVIVPYFVGLDISCGMNVVKTNFPSKEITVENIKKIMCEVRKVIPLGFKHHKHEQAWIGFENPPLIPIIEQELSSAKKQLGTLGGGNHFIELQSGSDGCLWLMIHSGSRNFGLKIANTYHKKAVEICEKYYSNIPHKDLSFLPVNSIEGNEYHEAMSYALRFARASRELMMVRFFTAVEEFLDCSISARHDIHHNYADLENHFGKNVMVHRKGATRARKHEMGIIPGSQGSNSYIVQGLGNSESFNSCSHGAGRTMSRKGAIANLNLEDEVEKLDEMGVIHSVRGKKDLDEAPGAYKNIEEVMNQQEDLVDILVTLKPLGVIKA